MGFREKVKKAFKKIAPLAASIAVGTVLPPAASFVAGFLREKFSEFNISVDDDTLVMISEKVIDSIKDMVEKRELANTIAERVYREIENKLLEHNRELGNLVSSAVEYALRDLYYQLESITKQVNEIVQRKEDLSILVESISEMEEVLQRHEKILNKLNSVLAQLPETINSILRYHDELFYETYPKLTKNLSPENIRAMSMTQFAYARTSSRYDLRYDSRLYVNRDEEEIFFNFVKDMTREETSFSRNIFLVLADAGIGKTWFLAHVASEMLKQGYPVFFLALGLGFKSVLEFIFGGEFYMLDQVFHRIHQETGKPVFLFLDGLDEVSRGERPAILRQIISFGGKKDVAIVLSCRTIDWITDHSIRSYSTSLNKYLYGGVKIGKYAIASVFLKEFTDKQVEMACEKYGIPKPTGDLLKVAKKPYALRLLYEYYVKHGRFPDPNNYEEFTEFITSTEETSIFERMGITFETRDLLFSIIEKFIESGKNELALRKIRNIIGHDAESWARIISSGLLKMEERIFGTVVSLDQFYGKYLILWVISTIENPEEKQEMAQKAMKIAPEIKYYVEIKEEKPKRRPRPIILIEGYGGRKEIEVPVGEIKIYRNEDKGTLEANINGTIVDLGIMDPGVSRWKHLTIRYDGKQLYARDDGSTNGTTINGKEIEPYKETPIKKNTKIKIGLNTEIKI